MKISKLLYNTLQALSRPGAILHHSYGSGTITMPPQPGERGKGSYMTVHTRTWYALEKRGWLKEVPKTAEEEKKFGYGRKWTLSDAGRAVLRDVQPVDPVARLTKFQVDLLRESLAKKDEPGLVKQWGLRENTRDVLDEAGYIERRLRYDTTKTRAERDHAILKAQIALSKPDAIDKGHWHGAYRYLQDAERLDDDMAELAYFVTDKGRKAVES